MNMPGFLRTSNVIAAAVIAIPATGIAAPSLGELGNITFSGIYQEPIRLVNGVYEGEPFVPGGAARPRVELLTDLYVTGDIDGDGHEDAWVLLNESSGGTAQFLYLAAVTTTGSELRNLGTVGIGDRIDVMALQAFDGRARLDYVAAGPDEPACCPTLMISAAYGLKNGQVIELSREERGTLSLDGLMGMPWRLTRFAWEEPVPEGLSITAAFEDDRISGSAGCNDYFAAVEAPTPYRLTIGPAGATRMACPPPQMEAEDRYLKALQGATQFSFVVGKLAISYEVNGDHGSLIFEGGDKE